MGKGVLITYIYCLKFIYPSLYICFSTGRYQFLSQMFLYVPENNNNNNNKTSFCVSLVSILGTKSTWFTKIVIVVVSVRVGISDETLWLEWAACG